MSVAAMEGAELKPRITLAPGDAFTASSCTSSHGQSTDFVRAHGAATSDQGTSSSFIQHLRNLLFGDAFHSPFFGQEKLESCRIQLPSLKMVHMHSEEKKATEGHAGWIPHMRFRLLVRAAKSDAGGARRSSACSP